MKKRRLVWKLLALSFAPISCLGALGVSTYAWFMARHRVEFQGENIKVEAPGFDKYELFAYSVGGNPSDSSEPVRSYSDYALLKSRYGDQIPAELDPRMDGEFASYFLPIDGIRFADVFPSTCFTFALYLESADFASFSVGLTADSSPSATQTNYLLKADGSAEPIVLASAIDVYSIVFDLGTPSGEAGINVELTPEQLGQLNAFLTTDMGNGDPVVNTIESERFGRKHKDRFDYRQDKDQDPVDSIERGLVEKQPFSNSKAALVVFTVEFTDFKDTHLRRLTSEDEKPASPIEGATYWVFDEDSRLSTPYQGLEFSIKTITANGNK